MSRKWRLAGLVAGVLALVGLAFGGFWLFGGSPGHTGASARHQTTRPSQTSRPAGAQPGTPGPGVTAASYVPPASTLIATIHGTVPKSAYPGGPMIGQVPGSWHGAPSVLPVVAQRPGWLEVRLAQRPNEATAWVLAQDATLSSTPYAIVLDLADTHLSVFRDSRKIFTTPIGIGLPQWPTPTGMFFLAFNSAPPIPAYGAFVMVTSAHSNAITDWEQSGDGMVAIHGPLGSDAAIGTTGARVSHGCIRLHEPDLLQLRGVPIGSPVAIFSS